MKIDLIIPPAFAAVLEREREPLTLTTDHPASHYGLGVLLNSKGVVFDGAAFREWRRMGARIETDSPEAVRAALGVPDDEPGIVEVEP